MDIPEEEVEQAIIWDLSLLKLRPHGKLELISRQRPLSTSDGFIDLLLEDGKRFYIVELKRDFIKNKTIVTNQVLRYRASLMQELELPANSFVCVLASPQGISDEVKEICKINHVIPKTLDEDKILDVLANKTKESSDIAKEETIYKIIFERRTEKIALTSDEIHKETKSIMEWIINRKHDDYSLKKIADLFNQISLKAPLEAHQVSDDFKIKHDYSFKTFTDQWFWLFYTALDKRSNASTFIKARGILEFNNLFLPKDIIKYLEQYGEEVTVQKITSLLEMNRFPLLHDFVLGKFAVATTIVSAAKLIAKYDYSFDRLYSYHIESLNQKDLSKAILSIQEELDTIHGVGPRMKAQFIRGMVLKGNWKLPLTDDVFLEKGRFNNYFAGPARFALIQNDKEYDAELRKLSDQYLDGNKAVISHALWYVRKKFCGKAKNCSACPMAGYCSYYLKTNTIKRYTESQESIYNWIQYPVQNKESQESNDDKNDLEILQNG